MIIKYVNHNGQEVDLNKEPYKLLVSDLLDYEWEPVTVSNNITGFGYGVREKKLNIDVHRTKTDGARANMNTLTEIFEMDILDGIPGRLYIDSQYMMCYIKSSEKDNWETDQIIQCEYGIITDFPFWITEEKKSFEKYNGSGNNLYLNYPYNFPYNYTSMQKGFSKLRNEHYASAHFRMTIYGPCVNPMIIIGGHTYIVNTIVGENEYLEIDSRNRTVIKTLIDGTKVNEFNNRGQRIFERIPPGELTVNWSGEFGFDIILYYERSEPKWIQG